MSGARNNGGSPARHPISSQSRRLPTRSGRLATVQLRRPTTPRPLSRPWAVRILRTRRAHSRVSCASLGHVTMNLDELAPRVQSAALAASDLAAGRPRDAAAVDEYDRV